MEAAPGRHCECHHVGLFRWAIGFMVTFAIGGMTGVLQAVPPADFVLHNSLSLCPPAQSGGRGEGLADARIWYRRKTASVCGEVRYAIKDVAAA